MDDLRNERLARRGEGRPHRHEYATEIRRSMNPRQISRSALRAEVGQTDARNGYERTDRAERTHLLTTGCLREARLSRCLTTHARTFKVVPARQSRTSCIGCRTGARTLAAARWSEDPVKSTSRSHF
jgi:hypothetical protein